MTLPTLPIERTRLDNGLRITVSEDHLVPVASVNLWYDVGSRDEEQGLTGLAHLFEHMMFQGSTNVGKVEHFQLIQQVGGSCNATTWLHRTNYFEEAPSSAWRLMMWLEADRMGGLLDALGQETLDNQRDVVKNEKRQRNDDPPYGTAYKRLQALTFPEGHPYHHTTIGSMEDLDAASLEDVRSFFRTHYAPANAVLSVVGDVNAAEVFDYAAETFGRIPVAPAPAPTPVPEVRVAVAREDVVERVPVPRIYTGSVGPAFGTPGWDALQVAVALLSGNEAPASKASRLYRRLVQERELAQDVTIIDQALPGVSWIVTAMNVRPGVETAAAEAALAETIEELAASAPSEREMERARAGLRRTAYESLGTTASRADQLSEAATITGDPAEVNERLGRLLEVSAQQASDAAREWLLDRVTVTFSPEAE